MMTQGLHWCRPFQIPRSGEELDCPDCFSFMASEVSIKDHPEDAEEEHPMCRYCGHPKAERKCVFCRTRS
jgi:hypothetical protein